MSEPILHVPTNIISGFLGVGKTTAILNLFADKAQTEKWAVLVNEFGKIGIDGRTYQAHGIAVKEIPGGCMCCAQGLPLQVAINRLLQQARPDRLLIESSGIGHPSGVLKTLKGDGFKDVLSLKAGICLLDARHLLQTSYQENVLFKEQLLLADILVANKTDLYNSRPLQAFYELADTFSPAKALVTDCSHGKLDVSWLNLKHSERNQHKTFSLVQPATTNEQSLETRSFSYPATSLFELDAIKHWLNRSGFIRAKALLQTKHGCYLINYSSNKTDSEKLSNCDHNHIDIIGNSLDDNVLKQSIEKCLLAD